MQVGNASTSRSLASESDRRPGPLVAVVVPTFNEVSNIARVVAGVEKALSGTRWELLFVDDDSRDGTADAVRALSAQDARIRVLQRVGRRGLSSACIEGMMATSATYIAVMDGDLQHDESLLPAMLQTLEHGDCDLVIGSRYVDGGSTAGWDGRRQRISDLATSLGRLLLKRDLRDPMSGFFMLKAEVFRQCVGRLSGTGYKILLDVLLSSEQSLRFKELPYRFRSRRHGASKLDSGVAWEYLLMLLHKAGGNRVPIRFLAFALVGLVGVGVHMGVLAGVLLLTGQKFFLVGQTVAALVAMSGNFHLNNILTYRDRRLHGWRLLRGWATFCLACSIGGAGNVLAADFLFSTGRVGWATAALAGILVGAMWNYASTSWLTWGRGSAS